MEKEVKKIKTEKDVKEFLLKISEGLENKTIPPIYAISALNNLMKLENNYDIFSDYNKKLCQSIWLVCKNTGLDIQEPEMIFE